jgi:hypothetical protein
MKALQSTYYVHKVVDGVVYIMDTNGPLSVTNDAEGVVATLNDIYPNHRVIYRDSNGDWDELLHDNGVFIGFKAFRGEIP